MAAGLVDWFDDPRTDTGVHFYDRAGAWVRHSYADLAMRARGAADRFLDAGLGPGDVVALGVDTGPDFFAGYYGTLIAGGVPCTIPTLSLTQSVDDFVNHLAGIVRVASPAIVVTDDGLRDLLGRACERAGFAGCHLEAPFQATKGHGDRRRKLADYGLLQFTSGSSGTPRGVQLTPANLEANVAMIRQWLAMKPSHATASWLPLYHDMGLIGCMITPTVNQSDLYLMKPVQFVQDPLAWLGCFGERGVRITAAPNFCLQYLLRVSRRERVIDAVQAMDFRSWEVFILGAERIDPLVMRRFAEWLAPQGFSAMAFMPAYGIAEATLAVSGVSLGTLPNAVAANLAGVPFGGAVPVSQHAALDHAIQDTSGWITGCGPALDGVHLRITGADGIALPQGHLGEIVVEGPTVCDGYRGGDQGGTSVVEDGVLHTGDAGFVYHDELFVVGRMGDSIKVNARPVFVEDLESKLEVLPGARAGQCVIVPGRQHEDDALTLLVEQADPGWVDHALGLLRGELGSDTRIAVLPVPKGAIQRTSSGKPRRKVMWRQFVDGAFDTAGAPVEPSAVRGSP